MTAEKCPVCEGRGTLPGGFYEPAASTVAPPETCRSCGGRGVILPTEQALSAADVAADPLDLTYRP